MATMELEASKLELISEILNINSSKTLERIKVFIKDLAPAFKVDDSALMSKEDFYAKIDLAKASIERGEGTKVGSVQELHSFLNGL